MFIDYESTIRFTVMAMQGGPDPLFEFLVGDYKIGYINPQVASFVFRALTTK